MMKDFNIESNQLDEITNNVCLIARNNESELSPYVEELRLKFSLLKDFFSMETNSLALKSESFDLKSITTAVFEADNSHLRFEESIPPLVSGDSD